jgi:hypothetical protein
MATPGLSIPRPAEFRPPNSVTAEAQISQMVAELAVGVFPRGLRAIVLTGSLARGEGTWISEGARSRLAGDAELLMVFADGALPAPDRINRLQRDLEARLAAAGVEAHIVLSPVDSAYLRRLRPHIFAYELAAHGKVVWGDARVLSLMPTFAALDIPLEDGFRLLLNRMIELLEAVCELEAGAPITERVRYRAMKLALDMGTSLLLFEHRYEPTYRGRAGRLADLAAVSPRSPLLLRRFADRVATATRYKLNESPTPGVENTADLISLIEDANALWRWELERLTGAPPAASEDELLRRWIAGQALTERMRGWASVARRYGVRRSLSRLPWWIVRAGRGSPRRLIYASAGELFAALPALLSGAARSNHESRWNQLRRELPADQASAASVICAWRGLGLAIGWNYHQFLEFTRS